MKHRKHGTGSVWTKSHLNNWYVSFYRDGKQHQINTKLAKTEENREAAEKFLSDEVAKKQLEIKSDVLSLNKIKYEDLRENLVAHFKRNGKASLSIGKDGIARLVGDVYLDKFFKGLTLDKIADRLPKYFDFVEKQPEVESAWIEKCEMTRIYLKHIKKIAPKEAHAQASDIADMARNATINRSLSTLRSMYSRYAKDFPKRLREGDIPSMPRIDAEKSDNIGQGFVTPETYEKIYNEMPDHLRPLTQFLYFTGMRSGAAKQITWSMVHPDKGPPEELRIPAGLMKNRESYSIPLVGPLAPIAETLSHTPIRPVDMPIFNDTNFRRVWNEKMGKLNLGVYDQKTKRYVGLHPHDFRRSAARNLIRAGVSQTVAQKITGHKSPAMFSRYNITDQSDVAQALVAVGEHHDSAVAGKANAR